MCEMWTWLVLYSSHQNVMGHQLSGTYLQATGSPVPFKPIKCTQLHFPVEREGL